MFYCLNRFSPVENLDFRGCSRALGGLQSEADILESLPCGYTCVFEEVTPKTRLVLRAGIEISMMFQDRSGHFPPRPAQSGAKEKVVGIGPAIASLAGLHGTLSGQLRRDAVTPRASC